MFSNSVLDQFRKDFNSAVKDLEKKYGVEMQMGTIRYDDQDFRFKTIVTKFNPNKRERLIASDFRVGDLIYIDLDMAPKAPAGTMEVIRVNRKNLKCKMGSVTYNVSPALCIKVS